MSSGSNHDLRRDPIVGVDLDDDEQLGDEAPRTEYRRPGNACGQGRGAPRGSR